MNEQIREKLNSRAAKRGFLMPPETILFTIQKKPIGSLQNIVCFQGMPKQGKSLFITSAIASAFTPYSIFDMKLNLPADRPRVCYIDTESSEYDFYRVLDRIRKQTLLESLPVNFDAYLMREDAPADILAMIVSYLDNTPKCSCIVIDGILDLLSDFNNVEQSFYLIQWLKLVTKKYNILVLCVLHLGKKEGLSLGHIGSFLDRKSQSVLKITKNKKENSIDMESTFLRSTDDIDTVSVTYQNGMFIQVAGSVAPDPVAMDQEFIDTNFKAYVAYQAAVNKTADYIGKSQTSAKIKLKKWVEAGKLVKDKNGYIKI